MTEIVCKATGVVIRVPDDRAQQLLQRGFAEIAKRDTEACVPDESSTIAEIKSYAAERGISLDGITKKANMLEVIREAM